VSIAKMQKVMLIGMNRQKRLVIDLLQEMGVMQIEEIESLQTTAGAPYDAVISEYESAITFLMQTFPKVENGPVFGDCISYVEMKKCVKDVFKKKLARRVIVLERELANAREAENGLTSEMEKLLPWQELPLPLEYISSEHSVIYITGVIPKEKLHLLEGISSLQAAYELVHERGEDAYLIVAVSRKELEQVKEVLTNASFVPISLPVSPRTVKEELAEIRKALFEVRRRREEAMRELASISERVFELMLVHDYFMQRRSASAVASIPGATLYTFALSGWVKKKDIDRLKRRLSSQFPSSLLIELEPAEGEVAPVALENHPLVQPFESVTRIYGLPLYSEVDPTPLLSVFFIVFFGICIGDAGYGLALAIAAAILGWKIRDAGAKRLLRLLFYGGIATFAAGSILGGWFGFEPSSLPPFLGGVRDFFIRLRFIDPMRDTLKILVIALSMGFLQVIFGLSVSLYIKLRDGDYVSAIFDKLLWIIYLISLALFDVSKALFHGGEVRRISMYVFIASAALLVLTQGRGRKNLLLKFGSGVLSLYNTVGYLSDVLSYSRLLALGLTTSIIAMVVNLIAQMTKEGIPILGYIFMFLILVVGHIFNIAVNVLGSFIHSSRLQFVEFFSKFMEGGGEEFRPFKRDSKYLLIE